MKIALYAHGGSANHGCEALVRSTIKVLGRDAHHFCVLSEKPAEDLQYGLDLLISIQRKLQFLPQDLIPCYLKFGLNWGVIGFIINISTKI